MAPFFVVNKATAKFDVPVLDMSLTNVERRYRELRSNFLVAVERRQEKDSRRMASDGRPHIRDR